MGRFLSELEIAEYRRKGWEWCETGEFGDRRYAAITAIPFRPGVHRIAVIDITGLHIATPTSGGALAQWGDGPYAYVLDADRRERQKDILDLAVKVSPPTSAEEYKSWEESIESGGE